VQSTKSFSVFLLAVNCIAAAELTGIPLQLTEKIPHRPHTALSGSEFAKSVAGMTSHQREQAILRQIVDGNIPDFLRHLVPVDLKLERPNQKPIHATVFVLPDYLAIGSNSDFLRIPMNLETATAVVDRLSFILPTRKIVDAIYKQSQYHFMPEPLPAGPEMRSTQYYQRHNAMIEKQAQARGIPEGALVSGDKKDVVLSNLLTRNRGRIAIYGWHRPTGIPIQPLSTVHGACYADYSHGIRLVSSTALVDGQPRPITDVLQNPALAPIVSDEGPIHTASVSHPPSAEDLGCGVDELHISGLASPVLP